MHLSGGNKSCLSLHLLEYQFPYVTAVFVVADPAQGGHRQRAVQPGQSDGRVAGAAAYAPADPGPGQPAGAVGHKRQRHFVIIRLLCVAGPAKDGGHPTDSLFQGKLNCLGSHLISRLQIHSGGVDGHTALEHAGHLPRGLTPRRKFSVIEMVHDQLGSRIRAGPVLHMAKTISGLTQRAGLETLANYHNAAALPPQEGIHPLVQLLQAKSDFGQEQQ